MADRASQKAACFCMPLENRRIGRFSSNSKTSFSFSYRSVENWG